MMSSALVDVLFLGVSGNVPSLMPGETPVRSWWAAATDIFRSLSELLIFLLEPQLTNNVMTKKEASLRIYSGVFPFISEH